MKHLTCQGNMRHTFGTHSQRKPHPLHMPVPEYTGGPWCCCRLQHVACAGQNPGNGGLISTHSNAWEISQAVLHTSREPQVLPRTALCFLGGWTPLDSRCTLETTRNATKTSCLPSSRPTDPTAQQKDPSGALLTYLDMSSGWLLSTPTQLGGLRLQIFPFFLEINSFKQTDKIPAQMQTGNK